MIGAGFAGLYAIYRLRGLGFKVLCVEAGSDLGGTWYWNRYPGARCDVESMSYSYSFDESLQQDWRWTRRYAEQPEILDYANHVARRFDLRRHIVFEQRVLSAGYNDSDHFWRLVTQTGSMFRSRFVLLATGSLSVPKWPELDGLDSFGGECFHTGSWPHREITFSGKRVALIGTGASGVQAAPVIAEQAASLAVLQRTANFSVPAWNGVLSNEAMQDWKNHYSYWRTRERSTHTGFHNEGGHPAAVGLSDAEKCATLESSWRRGGLLMWNVFSDLMTNRDANNITAKFLHGKIRSIVKDSRIAELLCPKGYPVGAKRLCVDSGYYEIFNRSNVSLVDLESCPVERIVPEGIVHAGQLASFDMIVCATGFDAITGAALQIDITGQDGVNLREYWRNGPRSYLGLTISEFPNLFLITGPGSPSVLSHVLMSIEQHVEWVSELLLYMRLAGRREVRTMMQAQCDWVRHVEEVTKTTLFNEAQSWYSGANVPGKNRVFMPYVGGAHRYRAHCNQVAAKGYVGFMFT